MSMRPKNTNLPNVQPQFQTLFRKAKARSGNNGCTNAGSVSGSSFSAERPGRDAQLHRGVQICQVEPKRQHGPHNDPPRDSFIHGSEAAAECWTESGMLSGDRKKGLFRSLGGGDPIRGESIP